MENVASKTDRHSHPSYGSGREIRRSSNCCVWALLLSFVLTSFAGCGGCGGNSQPATLDPNKPWGGLGSREAYMAWKEEHERKEAEETAKRAGSAKIAAEKRPLASESAEAEEQPDKANQGSPKAVAVRKFPNTDVSSPDAAPEQDAPSPVPQPPGDLTQWQERDYFIAKLLEKPELLEAVARSAVDKRDDEQIVQILTRLLQPEVYAGLKELVFGGEQEETHTSRRRRVSSTQRGRDNRDYLHKLIEAVVDALAQNTTATASRSLAQLIVGKLETEDNRAASTAALESLAAHPTESHEEMLFRLVVEAERLVDAAEPEIPADVLSRQALALLAEGSSSAVRVRAAEYLAQNNPPPEIRTGLERLLAELTPENLEAHAILYMGAGDPKPTRQVLAGHFAASSSAALEHLLGIKVRADAEQLDRSRQTARLLWSNSFTLVVEGRLNRLDSWSDEPALLTLALSLPTDTMRAAVARRLDVQWSRGPGLDHSQLLGGSTVVEPGILVLLRKHFSERGDSWKPSSLVGLRTMRPAVGRSARDLDPVAARQQQEQQLQHAWVRLTGDLAADWCARCRRAAHDRDAAERALGRRIDWSEALVGLPMQPHTSEGVTATHTVLWPGGLPAGASGAAEDPLAIHYVRIEERTRPARLLACYGRALPDHQRRDIENGVCFEGMHGEVSAGVLRSIDVRITRAGTEIRRLPDEEQDLVVEIIAVTIRDPDGSVLNGPS
mgnify:CR=1 FL=1